MNTYAFVRSDEAVVCKEQLLLCDFVEKVFAEEDVYVDEKQLERYLGLQKHFPYSYCRGNNFALRFTIAYTGKTDNYAFQYL